MAIALDELESVPEPEQEQAQGPQGQQQQRRREGPLRTQSKPQLHIDSQQQRQQTQQRQNTDVDRHSAEARSEDEEEEGQRRARDRGGTGTESGGDKPTAGRREQSKNKRKTMATTISAGDGGGYSRSHDGANDSDNGISQHHQNHHQQLQQQPQPHPQNITSMRTQPPHTTASSSSSSPLTPTPPSSPTTASLAALAATQKFRHTLGVSLLMLVVVLWVTSNFITSALFSDDTYSKPFFVAYIGSGCFCVYLIPWVLRGGVKELIVGWRKGERPWKRWEFGRAGYTRIMGDGGEGVGGGRDGEEEEEEGQGDGVGQVLGEGNEKLGLYDTIRLSVEFSVLWFFANYLSSVCYVYTNVASGTILGSTSSVWTLLFCAIFRVERFSWLKALSVLTSILGILLISKVDVASPSPTPSQPSDSTTLMNSTTEETLAALARSAYEILLGNLLALLGAVFYGIYVTLLKVRVGDESRLDVHLLFGFSGLIIILTTWPIIILFHLTGLEPFALPGSEKVWTMLGVNFAINVVSDFSWAYAMLLTTPLLATMGLSMSIPLALLGQMVVLGRFAGGLYWVGASLVFGAFLLVAKEEKQDEEVGKGKGLVGAGGDDDDDDDVDVDFERSGGLNRS